MGVVTNCGTHEAALSLPSLCLTSDSADFSSSSIALDRFTSSEPWEDGREEDTAEAYPFPTPSVEEGDVSPACRA